MGAGGLGVAILPANKDPGSGGRFGGLGDKGRGRADQKVGLSLKTPPNSPGR